MHPYDQYDVKELQGFDNYCAFFAASWKPTTTSMQANTKIKPFTNKSTKGNYTNGNITTPVFNVEGS